MARRHPSIRRGFFYLLLAIGVCAMPVANQYRRMAQFGSHRQSWPVSPSNTSLPGCRVLPDEKNVSEALELSSRDPTQGGIHVANTAAPMITTALMPQRPVEYSSLEITNCTDQQPALQSVRLLI